MTAAGKTRLSPNCDVYHRETSPVGPSAYLIISKRASASILRTLL